MDRARVAELIVTGPGGRRRGSGYRVTRDAVLTAAHVVEDAVSVEVRFEPDLPGQWVTAAVSWWADARTDIALLVIAPRPEDEPLIAEAFSRLGDRPGTVDVQAVGFPRWKMRSDAESADGRPERYRDSAHATGSVSTWSNWREGTLEVALFSTPAGEPGSAVSPWEGMSGAAVWAGDRIVGVISKHHPGDGVSTLAAARIERAWEVADPRTERVLRELLGLPEHAAELPLVGQEPTELVEVCPYPTGMNAFSPEQAEWFFGRETLTDELVDRLDQCLLYGRGPLIVVAPSGAGKSSLLRAGLLATLDGAVLPGSRSWPRVLMTPNRDPMATITSHLAALIGDEPDAVAAQLAVDPDRVVQRLHRAVHARRQPSRTARPRLLVIVDQLEELFTMCPDEGERQRFLDLLSRLAAPTSGGNEPDVLIVYGLRADFYAHCSDHPPLQTALQNNQVFVGQMTTDELRDAICKPAEHAGLEVERDLVEVLISDLGSTSHSREDPDGGAKAGRLPLLAHALHATWSRREGNTLTLAGYNRTGRIEGAVKMTADSVYALLNEDEKKVARTLFLRLVKIGHDTSDTRRRVPRDELLHAATDMQRTREVLHAFTEKRLLTQTQDTVEITHEALLHAWPRLRGWINEDREGNLVRQRLDEAAAAWEAEGHDTGALYRGTRLADAREQASSSQLRHDELSPTARTFLHASTRHENRVARRRRAQIAALSLLTIVSLVAAAVANWQRNVATANELTAQADRVREGTLEGADVSLSAQLNLAAYEFNSSDEGIKTKLYNAANRPLAERLTAHGDYVGSVAFSPDGGTLASGGSDGNVHLWDVAGPGKTTRIGDPLTGHGDYVGSVAFGPDGRMLASGGEDGTVRLWNVADRGKVTLIGDPLTGHSGYVSSVAFSPDGRMLASGGEDGTVRLWNVADRGKVTLIGDPLTGHSGYVSSVAFSPDGLTLASGSGDRTVQLWDVARPGEASPIGEPLMHDNNWSVTSVAFDPVGRILASGGHDGRVRLWDVADPRQVTPIGDPLTDHRAAVYSMAFSPDGRTLASGDFEAVQLWDVTDPREVGRIGDPLTGHSDTVLSVAFNPVGPTLASGGGDGAVRLWSNPDHAAEGAPSTNSVAFGPDGRTLASGGDDGTVRLWDVADLGKVSRIGDPLIGHSGYVWSVAFSPTGRTLASGGADGTVRLWDVAGPGKATLVGDPLSGHNARVLSVAFGPDGRTLASGGSDGTVRLWDVVGPGKVSLIGEPLSGHDDSVHSVAFSPDGRTLASGDNDGAVRLWDVADPAGATLIGDPLTGHYGPVYSVAFSPDSRMLVSSDNGGTVRLWDVTRPREAARIGDRFNGDYSSVSSVAFSPDGQMLVSSGDDGTVQLWDVARPEMASPIGDPLLIGHKGFVGSVAFSPDGQTLASGSSQGVQLQSLDIDEVVSQICDATEDYITPVVWQEYFPGDAPMESPCSDS